MAKPGQAVAARAKRGKRGVLLAAPELWPLLPSHASGRRRKVYLGDSAVNEEDPSATALPRCRRRNAIRRATFLRETHPYPSLLLYR